MLLLLLGLVAGWVLTGAQSQHALQGEGADVLCPAGCRQQIAASLH
jgi:hypothetical protein